MRLYYHLKIAGLPQEHTQEIFNQARGSKFVQTGNEDTQTILLDFPTQQKQYLWQHVKDKLIVVLVKRGKSPDFQHYSAAKAMQMQMPLPKLSPILAVYHRLDLLSTQYQAKLCLHLHYPATLETGSVFLTPYAFENPYEYMTTNLTEEKIKVSKCRKG